MTALKRPFRRPAVAVALMILLLGWGSALAVQDTFTVDLGNFGGIIDGGGTGFDGGAWYYYPHSDRLIQWFFNGAINRDAKKIIEVDLTLNVLEPKLGSSGYVEVFVHWTKLSWPEDQDGPPLPGGKNADQEMNQIHTRSILDRTQIRQTLTTTASFEIPGYCPQWVAIEIRGENVSVVGRIRHECTSKQDPIPPTGDRDFGDAPEGAVAYPSLNVIGQFPTCVGVGPAAWIEHQGGRRYFGPKVDMEPDGNAGWCPTFLPNRYDQDETMVKGDAGLLKPRAYTIDTSHGQGVVPLITYSLQSLGNGCGLATWGASIDIEVHNNGTDGRDAYVNVLMDWNHDGIWEKAVACGNQEVPEHVLVNFRVPHGYNGPLSGLTPPSFQIGPLPGYVWCRFTITERPVPPKWNGDGVFLDGETEDYLLHVREPLTFCEWEEGDPHKMHWPQLPDKQTTGIDVAFTRIGEEEMTASLADDFRCAQTGPITAIHFWGSFQEDIRPKRGIDSLKFLVRIYSNKPADNLVPWSRPGELLWSKEIPSYSYDFYEVSNNIPEGWFEPSTKFYEPENHERTYQYSVCFDSDDDLFVQRLGEIYWLEIMELRPKDAKYAFGWKTTRRHLQFNDASVWRHPQLGWLPLEYPQGHQHDGRRMDLSFVVVTPEVAIEDMDFGDAPELHYPTLEVSNGARHLIAQQVYLGDAIDPEPDGLPNATATGDDIDNTDDEDGVVFTTGLVPGDTALVEVTASIRGVLNGWIDWNADGDWDDFGEHVFDDVTLASGLTTLPIDVPVNATVGRTFARFRFSTVRGLGYTGLAPDGEVEDYRIRITDPFVPTKPPLDHLKWSQPPTERDLTSGTPVYCGWDEPASAVKRTFWQPTWKLVADDFRCIGAMPVTSVHWWGSYEGWQRDTAPSRKPDSWRIGFWSHVPAGTKQGSGRPGRLLWVVNVPADRVEQERAGVDEFPQRPPETTFQYLLELREHEYFWQDRYLTDTRDSTYWISISAYYSGLPAPSHPWGWKTRPLPVLDGAVKAEFQRDDLHPNFNLSASQVEPITNSLVCERLDKYDMAFELDTDPGYIKWEQPFTGLRHWAHYEDEESLATGSTSQAAKWLQPPDLSRTGVDVDMTVDIPPTWPATVLADDFECTQSGAVTEITIWASWYRDVLPAGSADRPTFTLSIREDIPAWWSSTGYSMPGEVLWKKDFSRGEFTVERIEGPPEAYYSPANNVFEPGNHEMVYKYTFRISAAEAFRQTGTVKDPTVYWLSAQSFLLHPPGSVATRIGWKTSREHWNDAAVWANAEEPFSGTWNKLVYPKGHTLSGDIDLAFAIGTDRASAGQSFRRVAADDWRCTNDLPVSAIVWWGSYIGYTYRPCECQQAPSPRRPDYFLLSIWSDSPKTSAGGFDRPGRKLWEYKAETFDEVMVGFDKHPEPVSSFRQGHEPVYRYTVRLPENDWFRQDGPSNTCWLSVVAVFEDPDSIVYPWGWTNHPYGPSDLQGRKMLARWKLDESSGRLASDATGNGNDATLVGNPIWKPNGGWMGGTLDFDGRGDYLKVDHPTNLDFAPESFSVSAWVHTRHTGGLWHAIMEYDRDGVNSNRFGLWVDPQGRFHFRVGMNTWHTPDSLTPGQWYLLTAVYDAGTSKMHLYVDGQLEATATQKKGFATPAVSRLTIGARGSGDNEYFDGLIDDVRIYGAALSEQDVLVLAGAGRNSGAVAGQLNAGGTWNWQPLRDQTGAIEDLSFMLFTEPARIVVNSDDKQ